MNEYGALPYMDKEKPRYSETTVVHCHFVHSNSALTGLRWNPGIRGEGLRLTAWTFMICAPESRQDLFLKRLWCFTLRGRILLTTPKVPQSSRPQDRFYNCQSHSRPTSLSESSTAIFINDPLKQVLLYD